MSLGSSLIAIWSSHKMDIASLSGAVYGVGMANLLYFELAFPSLWIPSTVLWLPATPAFSPTNDPLSPNTQHPPPPPPNTHMHSNR